MNFNDTIKNLGKRAIQRRAEGYMGDALGYSFQRHVLMWLRELVNETKENRKQLKKTIRANNVVMRETRNVLRRLVNEKELKKEHDEGGAKG